METDERMILKDMPVDTRNYTIVDNITGKPIDQSNYTLTIDNEVIDKLNTLKKMNEEKAKQAALKDKYGSTSLVSTFTPDDNAVFTPEYNDEYISYHDFNVGNNLEESNEEEQSEDAENTHTNEEPSNAGAPEVIQSDTLLERVVARDPSIRIAEEEEKKAEETPQEELDYISSYDPNKDYSQEEQSQESEVKADNSLFTPEMVGLQQASEQIVKIDENKLGEDIKKISGRRAKEKIELDKMEVMAGRKVAWMAYILFFLPLLFKRKNRFVRIHANEGLDLNIMEIFGGLLIGQFFLLPTLMTIEGMWLTISLIACMVGAGIVCACALTILIMIIRSIAGNYAQIGWLWKKRLIKVSTERTSE